MSEGANDTGGAVDGLDPGQAQALEGFLEGHAVPDQPGPGGSGEAPEIPTAQMLAPVLVIVSGFVAERRGDHWRLRDEETEALAGALGDVLDKYVPDIDGGPEWALAMALFAVVTPRVMEDKARAAALEHDSKGGDDVGADKSAASVAE